MAFIQTDDKLLDQQNQNQLQNQSTSINAPLVGGGSSQVSGNVSTAGIGAGGTGKWTNIQAYLNANKGVDTGATQMINDKVGGEFDKEKSQLQSTAAQTKSEAEKQVDPINDVKQNANQYLQQGQKDYSWQGNHGGGYQKALSAFNNARNAQYKGPQSYTYSFGAPAQQYQANLQNDESFNQFLGDMYQTKAGGQLSAGGRELQKQLNISNEPLQQARQNLLQRYAGLTDERDQTVKATNDAIQKAQSDLQSGKSYINEFLNSGGKSAGDSISKQEADAKAAYAEALKQGSGLSSAGKSELEASLAESIDPDFGNRNRDTAQYHVNQLAPQGLFKDNMTFEDLLKEQDFYKDNFLPMWNQSADETNRFQSQYDRNIRALNDFYSNQGQKFKDTADSEKKRFNLIQDILGGKDRKKQGFDVRGA